MPDYLKEDAARLLEKTIVIDGLGGAVVHPTPFVPEGSYEELMLKYGWTAFNACLVSEPSYTPDWEEVMAALYENFVYLEMNPRVRLCERLEDIYKAKRQGQLGIFFGLQSTSCIGQNRTRIRLLHKLGLRILQLTYMERNFVGDGCLEPENRGLTNFGIQVVRECNRLGIILDCSHVGVRAMLDAVRCSDVPIVVSHSAVYALNEKPRCVTDEQIKALAAKGGILGITAYAPFIRWDRRPTLDDYLDHFDYVIKLVGPNHVAIATDMFEGKTRANWATPYYYPEVTRGSSYGLLGVEGFNKKAELVNVVAGFPGRGYKEELIGKILGDNWLRVRYAETEVLRGINFSVQAGEIVSLLGPSGCGKTTTLRAIAGFVTPDSGSVYLEGREVTDMPAHHRVRRAGELPARTGVGRQRLGRCGAGSRRRYAQRHCPRRSETRRTRRASRQT